MNESPNSFETLIKEEHDQQAIGATSFGSFKHVTVIGRQLAALIFQIIGSINGVAAKKFYPFDWLKVRILSFTVPDADKVNERDVKYSPTSRTITINGVTYKPDSEYESNGTPDGSLIDDNGVLATILRMLRAPDASQDIFTSWCTNHFVTVGGGGSATVNDSMIAVFQLHSQQIHIIETANTSVAEAGEAGLVPTACNLKVNVYGGHAPNKDTMLPLRFQNPANNDNQVFEIPPGEYEGAVLEIPAGVIAKNIEMEYDGGLISLDSDALTAMYHDFAKAVGASGAFKSPYVTNPYGVSVTKMLALFTKKKVLKGGATVRVTYVAGTASADRWTQLIAVRVI